MYVRLVDISISHTPITIQELAWQRQECLEPLIYQRLAMSSVWSQIRATKIQKDHLQGSASNPRLHKARKAEEKLS